MDDFSAARRAQLTQELHTELYDIIHEHGNMTTMTVAEIIGVLEMLKFEIMAEHSAIKGADE